MLNYTQFDYLFLILKISCRVKLKESFEMLITKLLSLNFQFGVYCRHLSLNMHNWTGQYLKVLFTTMLDVAEAQAEKLLRLESSQKLKNRDLIRRQYGFSMSLFA
jgi:hypothetical protein